MEPNTKKGLIIGGSVLAVALLCTGLGLGLYYGLRSNGEIQTWGYDDQVSSTAKKVNWYMGTETRVVPGQYGGVAVSSETALRENGLYNSVKDDMEILDGVAGSKQGLGYLSTSWVSNYKDEELRILNLDDGTGNFLIPSDEIEGSLTNYTSLVNSDTDKTYGKDDLDGITLDEFSGEIKDTDDVSDKMAEDGAYINTEDGNIYTIKIDGTAGTVESSLLTKYKEEMSATLNIHLKVPAEITGEILPLIGKPGTITAVGAPAGGAKIGGPTVAEEYLDFLQGENYLDDFLLSVALFDYIAYDASNIEEMNTMLIPGTSTDTAEFDADTWAVFEETWTNFGGNSDSTGGETLADAIVAQESANSGTYEIKVDGTGTNSGAVKAEIENFAEEFSTFAGEDVNFVYDLDNGGSGEGWKLPNYEIPGTTGSAESNARPDAFLGTQSRFSKAKEYTNFGYDESTVTETYEAKSTLYTDPSTKVAGDIIGYTMGLDLPVFFVQEEMEIDYTVSKSFVDALAANPNLLPTGSVKEGDNVTVKPLGITPEAAKTIYEGSTTWVDQIDAGLIQIELV